MTADFPRTRLDPDTQHEHAVDPEELTRFMDAVVAELAAELPAAERIAAMGRLGSALRVAGHLDDALEVHRDAVARSDPSRDPAAAYTARIRLAHTHQWRREFDVSNAMFTQLLAESTGLPDRVRAFAQQHAGRNMFDQGDYAQALVHFSVALQLREQSGAPEEEIASSQTAWTTTVARVTPYR